MSDISIPGVSSRFNTEKLVEDLMEVERKPLNRMEERVDTLHEQKRVWQDVNRGLQAFRESANALYGFQNPFNDRISTSSDPRVLTATATREARESVRSVQVLSTAKADRFASQPVDRDFRVDKGTYTFTVGDEQVSFTFPGGSLQKFATTLSERGRGLVDAQVINDTRTTQTLVIESLRTGVTNKLSFQDAAADLGRRTGLIEPVRDTGTDLTLSTANVRPWTQPLDQVRYEAGEESVLVRPGGELSLPVQPPVRDLENLVLELRVAVNELPREEYTPPEPPPGPGIQPPGSVELEGIELENAPSTAPLPEWDAPEPPQVIDDMTVLHLQGTRQTVPLPDVPAGNGETTIRVQLSDYVNDLEAVNIRNRNTYREISVQEVRIFDPNARGEHRPQNALSQAEDAEVLIDGVRAVRPENAIDDLIPGVTLNLHEESDRPVELAVEPDRDAIKDAVINFVGYYNQFLVEANILTRGDESVIDEIGYFTDEERDDAQERLGMFRGDITLNQMRSHLQRLMMDPYRTEHDLALLAQVGISTNVGPLGGTVDRTRLRGYLQVDEGKLEQALQENMAGVKELFGRDSDGDFVVDSGVAVAVEQYVKPYVQTGGILATRMSTIDTQVSRTNREIETYTKRLDRYEQELKREYGAMEGMIESMEEDSKAIDNFTRQNSGSSR